MIIRFESKPTQYGSAHQLEYDDNKKTYRYGAHLFCAADVSQLTKKQLDAIEHKLIVSGYKKDNT